MERCFAVLVARMRETRIRGEEALDDRHVAVTGQSTQAIFFEDGISESAGRPVVGQFQPVRRSSATLLRLSASHHLIGS